MTARSPIPFIPLPTGMTPRKWQREAMEAIYAGVKTNSKILVSAATGTGKGSLIAALAVRVFHANQRLLFLVHRDELIDDVMARAKAAYAGIDAGKVKGAFDQYDRQIVFASVQSLRGKRLTELGHFDYVVTDEAHHATAPSYLAIYEHVGSVNPNWKHIGFTATPFRYGGYGKTAGLGKAFERLVYEYPLSKAIEDGALCPIRGVAVETHLDLSGVNPDNLGALVGVVDTPSRNKIVAEKYLELAVGKPAICFSITVDHAARLAQAFVKAGVNAEVVWGTDPNRAEKIARYKEGKTQVLCNCELLTEGFDAPQTEAVILVRPTGSIGLYSQMVGRVTRLSPGKKEGLVIDFVGNAAKYPLIRLSDLTTPEDPGIGEPRQLGTFEKIDELLSPPVAIGAEHAAVDLFARPKSTFYGYARGANSQELAPHTTMIRASGCALLRIDLANESAELTSLMSFMRRGDVLVVSHISHLSNSMDGVNLIMQEMVSRGIELRLAKSNPFEEKPEQPKLLTPNQRAAVQQVGIEKAKQEGVYSRGRPRKVEDKDVIGLIDGGMSKSAAARKLGISRETVHQCVRRVKIEGAHQ